MHVRNAEDRGACAFKLAASDWSAAMEITFIPWADVSALLFSCTRNKGKPQTKAAES
jgi:hypothetical protein